MLLQDDMHAVPTSAPSLRWGAADGRRGKDTFRKQAEKMPVLFLSEKICA